MVLIGTVQKGVVVLPADAALLDGTKVRVEPVTTAAEQSSAMDAAYIVLSQRFSSGERDVAARHNEHQP